MNMLDYLVWRGDLSFTIEPFNEIDGVILSEIVYLELENIVPPDQKTITIQEASKKYREAVLYESLNSDDQNVYNLFKSMGQSRRFKNALLSYYVNDVNQAEESQFSAVKIQLDNGIIFISFSGTDKSVIAWKENFNMTYMKSVPSQEKAVAYVEKVIPFFKHKVILGGHSKGGNLAVYSAMHVSKRIRNKIISIYNNDGPGFTDKMIDEEAYYAILKRIHTYVPQSSFFGMLMEREEEITIIKSNNVGLTQHNPFSWEVLGTHFVRSDALESEGILLNEAAMKCLFALDEQPREEFINNFFSILEKANITDTNDLSSMTFAQNIELLKMIDELPVQDKDMLKQIFKEFFTAIMRGVFPFKK